MAGKDKNDSELTVQELLGTYDNVGPPEDSTTHSNLTPEPATGQGEAPAAAPATAPPAPGRGHEVVLPNLRNQVRRRRERERERKPGFPWLRLLFAGGVLLLFSAAAVVGVVWYGTRHIAVEQPAEPVEEPEDHMGVPIRHDLRQEGDRR